MRLTNKLYAQHIGWHFKKIWQVKGKRIVRDTGAVAELNRLGINFTDANEEVTNHNFQKGNERIVFENDPLPRDETHPNWHNQGCHIYDDQNVLIKGIPQAQVLTNTIEIDKFPENVESKIESMQLAPHINRNVQNAIMASHVFDSEQVKLPKIKMDSRPGYVFPRVYGISLERRCRLLMNKLIFECEKAAGQFINKNRKVVDSVDFNVTLPREDVLIQFALNVEKLITCSRPIDVIKEKHNSVLPDLFPLYCTISIPEHHIYSTENFFPLSKNNKSSIPHTVITYFNKQHVTNLHESVVDNCQIRSRTLLKAFAVATSHAKQLYGNTVVAELPKPIVVQSIQTDGRFFHFGIFQLNTLSLDSKSELKNYWFHQPLMNLFEECGYKSGRPYLEGYNKNVFRCLNAFYNNS